MRSQRLRALLGSLLLALAYIACAQIGFSLAFSTKQVTAVWPPTGIAVAALILYSNRLWPGILVGAFVSNALTGEPLWTAAIIAAGNTLAPLSASVLLRRAGFDGALQRARDVIALILISAICMTISATNGVLMLAAAGIVPWQAFVSVWTVWWAGDTMGVLLVAPAILTFVRRDRTAQGEGSSLELALLFAVVVAITWLSFVSASAIRFSVYPLLIWSALRFGQRETAGAILAIAAICIWGSAHQLGAFGAGTLDQRLIAAMSFLAVLMATGLILGATTSERRTANERLARATETLQSAFLPSELPQRPDLRCDALFLTTGSETPVGGDWYDAFEIPDGSIVISIGDVTGHGFQSAVTAARLRQAIFTSAFDTTDPAEVLERVNRTSESQVKAIATALVAVVDPTLRSMRYACAGHPPPMMATPSAPAISLPHGGLTLGVGSPVAATTHLVNLPPGSAIVFYTDGLVEFDRNIEKAERALAGALTALAWNPPEPHPSAVLQRAVMGDARPKDDVALVVVQIT